MKTDIEWLQAAIELSRQCQPVPGAFSVGALLVDPDDREISSGYSRETNDHVHAEEVALAKARHQGADVSQATLYTSLEPCSVRLSGRTSCADHILAAQIPKVVFALAEPAVFVTGEGEEKLRQHGVQVVYIASLARFVEDVNRHLIP